MVQEECEEDGRGAVGFERWLRMIRKVDVNQVIAELEDIKKKIENDEFEDLFYQTVSEAVEVTKKKLESGELYEAWKRMALAYIRYQIEIVRNLQEREDG